MFILLNYKVIQLIDVFAEKEASEAFLNINVNYISLL
jgi:hypothetical protein